MKKPIDETLAVVVQDELDNCDDERMEDCNESDNINVNSQDLFQTVAQKFSTGAKVGAAAHESLTALTNQFVNIRANYYFLKAKNYLRPKNIHSLEAPKLKRPVWENLSLTKLYDTGLVFRKIFQPVLF